MLTITVTKRTDREHLWMTSDPSVPPTSC